MKQTEDKGPCKCGGCGKAFRRLSGFDRHRYGPYTDRRCLTSASMVERGFWIDSTGKWGAKPHAGNPSGPHRKAVA